MHKSPSSGQPLTVPVLHPTRGSKVLSTVAAALLFVAFGCALVTPPRAAAQDAPPTAASPAQPPDQPANSAVQSFDLSDEVVRDVLSNFQRGLETRNLDRVLDTFDPDATKDYPQIHDQFVAFFRLHDSIKFRYQLLQVTADKDVSFATADVEMDADPADILPTERRRSTQMRFQMKRTPKGWRLTGLRPMDFFTQ